MTNGAGIAACSAVLQQLFQESLGGTALASALGGTPTVTVLPPDRITVGTNEDPQLNLFVYNATPNSGWANRELPSHAGDGRRSTAAPLAVDLHYVVSAYGKGNFHSDVLLGHAALVLHATRCLSRERIRDLATATGIPMPLRTLVAASGLDEQEETIRLAPEHLSIEDINKLWSVLGERYRTSLAFTASVLVLRPDVETRESKPVSLANLRVRPLPIPGIERITPGTAGVGDTVVIEGHGLRTQNTVVRFGAGHDVPAPADATAERIQVDIPTSVQAGLSAVQVVHSVDFGPASGQRHVADSNLIPLVIRPRIATVGGSPAIDASSVTSSAGVVTGGTLDITLEPEVGREQRVRVILDGTGALEADAAVLDAPSRRSDQTATTPTISVDPSGLTAGTYLVRVEVNGVATAMSQDVAPGGARGPFDEPTVVLS